MHARPARSPQPPPRSALQPGTHCGAPSVRNGEDAATIAPALFQPNLPKHFARQHAQQERRNLPATTIPIWKAPYPGFWALHAARQVPIGVAIAPPGAPTSPCRESSAAATFRCGIKVVVDGRTKSRPRRGRRRPHVNPDAAWYDSSTLSRIPPTLPRRYECPARRHRRAPPALPGGPGCHGPPWPARHCRTQ